MELKELQRNWTLFGDTDPFGSILSEPSKLGGNWEIGEFFRKGVEEIAEVMDRARSLRPDFGIGEALDFGCGAGRLTQALCLHFDRCHGVDIAPSMIRHARRYNTHGDRCTYHLNEVDDLRLFEDDRFDFVYSMVVLQHMRPEYARSYLAEFIRVLVPGGLIVFQLPAGPNEEGTHASPLPDSAFRAEIEPLARPSALRQGERATLRLRLKNNGDTPWPAWWDPHGRYNVNIGNHWLDQDGNMLVHDDGRMGLDKDLKPGQEVETSLTVTAPDRPGRYVLEVDLVQEANCWFKQKGSPTATISLEVRPDRPRRLSRIFRKIRGGAKASAAEPAPAPESGRDALPIMEMYGIERPEVEALIERNGAKLLNVDTTTMGDWIHGRYFVTKPTR